MLTSARKTRSLLIKLSAIILAFALTGCGEGFETSSLLKSASLNSDNTTNNDDNNTQTPAPTPAPKTSLGSLSAASSADLELGDELIQTVTITAASDFSGEIDLSVDRSSIMAVSGQQDIVITLTPASVNLAAGASADIEVKVESLLSAPSFAMSQLKIVASASDDSALDAETNLGVQVRPVVTMRMFGGNVPADRWDRPATINFRAHSQDLLIRFANMNTDSTHIVHGNGAIPHQNVGMPSDAAANAGEEGGVYEVTIDANDTAGSYYYHDIENGNFRRFMNFNQANPAPPTNLSAQSHSDLSLTQMEEPVADVQTCADILGSDDI